MHPWVFPCIFWGIGFLYLIINVGANIETKKLRKKGIDYYVSGVPLLGGIHFLIAGLISPVKWLALLCVLDYTFLSFLYSKFTGDRSKKNEENDEVCDLKEGIVEEKHQSPNDDG